MIRTAITTFGFLVFLTGTLAPSQTMPSFYARQDYIGYYAQSAVVGDTNRDGIPDLIAADEGGIFVLYGNGDGTFRAGPSDERTIVAGYAYLAASDLNGDGNIDLVFSAEDTNFAVGIVVCLGNGDGTFQSGTFYAGGVGQLALGDFNNDGILDIAETGSNEVWLFTGKGNGTFDAGVVAVPLKPGTFGLAAADFNEDGNLDLVVTVPNAGAEGDEGNGFYVILGNGNGTFQAPKHFSPPGRIWDAVAGNLGTGGHAGIALSIVGSPDAAVYMGDGTGGFSGPKYINLPNGTGATLAIADLNGDGIPDLVSVDGYAYIAFGTASNTFDKPVGYPIQSGDGIWNLTLADLRNDGRTDIVTDAQDGISVLLSETKGEYEDGIWTKLAAPAGCGVSGDFNGDGKPDLAVNTSTGITILRGTGKAAAPLKVGESIALANAGCLTQAADINGDGILDLVITSATDVMAYLGNGDGTFTMGSSTPITSGAEYVVLADFNHDGKLDFATDGNQLAYGNGDGTFQTPAPFVANGPAFDNITVGDINNDGWPDLVLTNFDLPYVDLYVLLNNQQGGFTQVPQNFGADSTGAVLADLNGDGFLDLVTTNLVYLGDGKGDFTFLTDLGFNGAGGTFDMISDVNGDGIPDIAVLGSGTVQIYLGVGKATYATPFYLGTGPAPGVIFPANLHGQKAKAGVPDLVAPDETGGVMVLTNTTK